MAWQCMKCLHHIPDGVSHSCINDEIRDLQKRYTYALKMLEEMAGAANNIHLKFDKDLAFIGGLAALNETLDNYRKWKEGIK